MFLKWLSGQEDTEEYWPFVLRMETVLAGIVKGSAVRLAPLEKEERLLFLYDALGAAFDRRNSPLPSDWWPEPIPSMDWLDDWLRRELDSITAEAKRRVAVGAKSEEKGTEEDGFDRAKIRDCAHRSERFRAFLLPEGVPPHDHRGETENEKLRSPI